MVRSDAPLGRLCGSSAALINKEGGVSSEQSPGEFPRHETDRGQTEQLAAVWARVRGRLQHEVGEVEYRTWLKHMTLVGVDGDEVTIALPSRFMRDWVRSHHADVVMMLWQAEMRIVRRVEFIVRSAVQIGGLAEPLPV